jgi:hypothetical protein
MAETTFYEKFKANMNRLGMPAPESLFGTLATAVATIEGWEKVISRFGPRVTVRELIYTAPGLFTATALADFATMTAGVTAAAYVGACIGSFVVATGQTLSATSFGAAVTFPLRMQPAAWMWDALEEVMVRQRAGQ